MTKSGVLTLPWIFEFAVFLNSKADVSVRVGFVQKNVPLLAMALVNNACEVPQPCSIMRAEFENVRGTYGSSMACACQGTEWRDYQS